MSKQFMLMLVIYFCGGYSKSYFEDHSYIVSIVFSIIALFAMCYSEYKYKEAK